MSNKDPKSCPHCNSKQTVKNGHTRHGKQRFLCRSCRRTFGRDTGYPRIRLKKQYASFLSMCQDPIPLRLLAGLVDVSVSTAFRWRHIYLQTLEDQPVSTDPEENRSIPVIAVAANQLTAGAPQTFLDPIGSPPNIAKSPPLAAVDNGTLVATVVHFITLRDNAVVEVSSRSFQGRVNNFSLRKCLSQELTVDTMVNTPRHWGPLSHTVLHDDIFSRSFLFASKPVAESPNPIQPTTKAQTKAQHKIATTARQRIYLLFLGWIRSFFGISLKYLDRYIRWFNHFIQTHGRALGVASLLEAA